MTTRRQLIMDTIEDLVVNLVYYDRKEDADLPVGAIEAALDNGELTVADMIRRFSATLRNEYGETA